MRSPCVAHDSRLNGCTIDVVIRMRVRNVRTRFCAGVGRFIASNGQRWLHKRDGGEHRYGEFRHSWSSQLNGRSISRCGVRRARDNVMCVSDPRQSVGRSMPLKLRVEPHRINRRRAAISVIAGVFHPLIIKADEHLREDIEAVIRLDDLLRSGMGQPSVPDEDS